MSEVIYTISPDDLTAANRLHFLKSFSIRRWLVVFISSAAAIALILWGIGGILDLESFLIALGSIWAFIVTVCIVGWLMIPLRARRNWSQAQKMWIGQQLIWDAEKIHFKSEKGEVHVSWDDYYRWAADERSLLLYQDDRMFYIVPLRSLPSGTRETMAGYLNAAGVRER